MFFLSSARIAEEMMRREERNRMLRILRTL